ncbi:anti-sigma E factor [Grimontia sp. AD028]|uniref:Anti-sigma-E factor RseA n=1 Tax=Grimontia indica TaxID=1056512 RepID=R1GX01_9GAMM|nr:MULTISPECIES: RseA family anti-sigma factor [Grimontia]EOD80554.1 Sigma factor RpoE negative regulatory protein RseA [Grimontia indica]KKD60458.1 anti-sigma E factor [Grimontia sp. AD028]
MAEKENLSALFDGDEIDQAMIDALENDQSAQQTWKSFAVTRDVMRGETPNPSWDIASNVAMALEAEPAHGAHSAPNVVPIQEAQPTPAAAKKGMPSWLQQLTQVGMAAAVSLAVIVGVQQYNGGEQLDPVLAASQPPVLQTIPLAGSAEPVSLSRETLQGNPTEAQLMEQRRRVNAMFQDYELQLRLNADEMIEQDEKLTPEVSN